jgi:hypothetical protein
MEINWYISHVPAKAVFDLEFYCAETPNFYGKRSLIACGRHQKLIPPVPWMCKVDQPMSSPDTTKRGFSLFVGRRQAKACGDLCIKGLELKARDGEITL